MISVRRPNPEDLLACLNLVSSSIRELASSHYGESEIEAWINQYPRLEIFERWRQTRTMFVAFRESSLVGYGCVDIDRKEIAAVHVDPSHIRRGIGTRLIESLENFARDAGVDTLSVQASLNAVDFYASCGYRSHGPTKFHCRNGVDIDAIAMDKILDASRP